jgi:hypothetical protein
MMRARASARATREVSMVIQRRCLDFERGGGFPAPDELGIKIAVALSGLRGHERGVAGVF